MPACLLACARESLAKNPFAHMNPWRMWRAHPLHEPPLRKIPSTLTPSIQYECLPKLSPCSVAQLSIATASLNT